MIGRFGLAVVALCMAATAAAQPVIEAVTSSGERVRLLPNGRWEYVDEQKAQIQRKAAEDETERERKSQGGWFGFGRKIYEGDKDYNRGSLNPRSR